MSTWVSPPIREPSQLSLFTCTAEEARAELKVSSDECQRWKSNGWLSFDIADHDRLEPLFETELAFITAIARSGLNDAVISKLLEPLKFPYRYDPRTVAYSFRDGWVQCPPEKDREEIVQEYLDTDLGTLVDEHVNENLENLINENIDSWLQSNCHDQDRLADLKETITDLLYDSIDDEDSI